MLQNKCHFPAYPIFRDFPSDIMSLEQISHPWNITEYTPDFNGIPPHILLISDIKVLKLEIESPKGTIIHQQQYYMDKGGFSSTEHNTKTVIDEMASKQNRSWKT